MKLTFSRKQEEDVLVFYTSGNKAKKVKYLIKKWKKNDFCFTQKAHFFTDKQELI